MTLGSNIKAIREERKLTQQELAKKVGLSRSYLSDLENNRKSPSMNTVESLAEKLNVTTSYMVRSETNDTLLRDATESELIAEYERRGWHVTITRVASGCCSVGKKLVMTWMP